MRWSGWASVVSLLLAIQAAVHTLHVRPAVGTIWPAIGRIADLRAFHRRDTVWRRVVANASLRPATTPGTDIVRKRPNGRRFSPRWARPGRIAMDVPQ